MAQKTRELVIITLAFYYLIDIFLSYKFRRTIKNFKKTIILKVVYTVREDYVETNKQNIQKVMDDLNKLNNPNIKYASFLEPDGKTFMHFAMYPDEKTLNIVNELPSFNFFRKSLKESKPLEAPKQTDLSLVASAYELFN